MRMICWAVVALLCWPAGQSPAIGLGQQLFIASRGSNTIVVLDTETLSVDGGIELAARADQYVLSADHERLIATSRADRTLSFVALSSRETVTVRNLSMTPDQIELHDGAGLVAVSDFNTREVSLFGIEDGRERLAITNLPATEIILFDRDGGLLLVAGPGSGLIHFVDTATGLIADRLELPLPPVDLVRTPGGLTAVALHGDGGQVSVIDLKQKSVISTVDLAGPAQQAYPTVNNQYFMVPSESDASVSFISVWTAAESDRLPGSGDVAGINAGLFDTIGAVLDADGKRVRLLDLREQTVVRDIALGTSPETAAVDADGIRLFIALPDSNTIAVVDLRERRLVTMIEDIGDGPWGVSFAGGLSYCH